MTPGGRMASRGFAARDKAGAGGRFSPLRRRPRAEPDPPRAIDGAMRSRWSRQRMMRGRFASFAIPLWRLLPLTMKTRDATGAGFGLWPRFWHRAPGVPELNHCHAPRPRRGVSSG
jgi:hypothetical protein